MALHDVGPGIAYDKVESRHVFRLDLEKVELKVLPPRGRELRQPVKGIAQGVRGVAINASFFNDEDRAIGAVVSDGAPQSTKKTRGWGALVVQKHRARMVAGAELNLDEKPDLVVQGIPRLIVDGKLQKLKAQSARRTAVCAEGQFLWIVVETESADTTKFAQFLASLGCTNALNFDGGPSTQLETHLPGLELSEPGQPVPNALVATPR